MKPSEVLRFNKLLVMPLLCIVFASTVNGQTIYRNRNYGFQVTQPKGWTRQEGLDGYGIGLYPPVKVSGTAEIHLGALRNQPSEQTPDSEMTLEENVDLAISALQEYGHAQKIVIVKRQHTTFSGMDGAIIAVTFVDSQSGHERYEIETLAVNPNGGVYSVTLDCDASESSRLLPVYDAVVKSFVLSKKPLK